MDEKLCIDTISYEDRRTVFPEGRRQYKANKRPELREEGFLKRIEDAIRKPTFVYRDFEDVTRKVCYLEEYRVNGRMYYVKVVLAEMKNGDLEVMTAFRPDYVKERGKTELLYGTDDGKK